MTIKDMGWFGVFEFQDGQVKLILGWPIVRINRVKVPNKGLEIQKKPH